MAKITIIITDDGERAKVTFIPDKDFDVESDEMTAAQHASMRAMDAICDEPDVDIADDERLQ